jgi:hypothetical protein
MVAPGESLDAAVFHGTFQDNLKLYVLASTTLAGKSRFAASENGRGTRAVARSPA